MKETLVKIMQCAVVSEGLLKIANIGSGMGVILYSPGQGIGAGIHVLAPHSGSFKPRNPIMYANTAVPHVLEEMRNQGASPPFSVAVAGGSAMLAAKEESDTGSKLAEAIKEALANEQLRVKIDQTGGTEVRTMILNIDSGKIKIS